MSPKYFNFFNFDVLKSFIKEFPNFGIWWNKLEPTNQYYVILYSIISIICFVSLMSEYKKKFSDEYNSLNIFKWIELLLHNYFCIEMFLFCLKLSFFGIPSFGLPWAIEIIVIPLSLFIFLGLTIVLPYYLLHKITKRWTPLFPW